MTLNLAHHNYGITRSRITNLAALAEYHFNDVNQSLIKNYAAQALPGSLGSTPPTVTNKGLLVAEGQFAQIPINALKPTSSGLSVLCYFTATTKTTGMRLFFTDAVLTFSLYCYSNDSVGFDFNGATAQNTAYQYLNNKVCAIATFLPNNAIQLFVNKIQVASTGVAFNETVDIGSNCFIGKEATGTQNYFNGEMHCLITYPFALTQAQINIETNNAIRTYQ